MASSSRRVVPTLEALLGTTNIKPREWHHIDPEIWEDNVEAPDDEVGITTATTYIARAIADYTDRPTADEELFWEFRQDFEGWTEAMFLRAQPIYTKELKRILRFKGVYTGRINMAPSESLARLLRMEEYLEWPQDVFQSAVFDTRSAAHMLQERALRQQRSEGSVQSTDRRLSSQAQSRTQTPVRTRGRDVDSRQTRDQDQTHARVQGRQETVEEEQQIQDQLAKTIEKAQNQPIRSQPVETTESAPQPAYQRVQSQQPPLTYNNFDRFREYTPAYPQLPPIEFGNEKLDPKTINVFVKMWDRDKKYTGKPYDLLDDKLKIFYSICYHADIEPGQFHAVFPRILDGRAEEYYLHFVDQRMDTFLTAYTKLKNHFDTDVNHGHYYADWTTTSFVKVRRENPEKNLHEVLDIMLDKLQLCQRALGQQYMGEYALRTTVITACRGVKELEMALYKPSLECEVLFGDLRSSIENSLAMTVSVNFTEADTDSQYYLDRRYNNNSSGRLRGNYNPRGGRSGFTRGRGGLQHRSGVNTQIDKKCYVCGKTGCWSTNHTLEERKRSKAQYITHCAITGEQMEFSTFLVAYEGEEVDQFFLEEQDEDDEDQRLAVKYLTDQAFLHHVTGEDVYRCKEPITPATQFLIEDRYSRITYQGILPDTGASNVSTAGKEQFWALQTEDPTVTLDTSTAGNASVQFGKGSVTTSIGTAHVSTQIGKIKFEVLNAPTPFLLCLKDMDRLHVYFNNTTDQLVQGKATFPVIRKWGHPWFHLSKAERARVFLTETELRHLHRRFGHPAVERLIRLLKRAGHEDVDERLLREIQTFCHHCQAHDPAPRRFKFRLKDDREFNFEILVDVMYLSGKPVLHVIDSATTFNGARFLPSMSAKDTWEALRLLWIDTYQGPPDIVTHDAGTNFASVEFRSEAKIMGITCKQVPTEAHWSIGKVERYHAPLRRAYEILRTELDTGTSDAAVLQMAVKAVNDTAGPDGLVPTLLVFGAYPRISMDSPPSPSITHRAEAIQKAMRALRKASAEHAVSNALGTRNGPTTDGVLSLPLQSEVMVWREKNGWQGPYRVIDMKDHDVTVDMINGPTTFRSTVVKPYYRDLTTAIDGADQGTGGSPTTDEAIADEPPLPVPPAEANQAAQPRKRGRPPGSKNKPKVQYLSKKEEDDYALAVKLRNDGVINVPGAPFEASDQKEIDDLVGRGVFSFELFDPTLHGGYRIFKSRMVREVKGKTMVPYEKSRLVVQGYNDEGKHEILTQSPTIQRASQRLILALAPALLDEGMVVELRDITQAYPQAQTELFRTVLAHLPKELITKYPKGTIIRVIKPLYGIAEAGVHWFATYQGHHCKELDMATSTYDPCLLITNGRREAFGIVGLQTDDTLAIGTPAFSGAEDAALQKANFRAKPKERLSKEVSLEFNGCTLTLRGDTILLTQKGQGAKIEIIDPKAANRAQKYMEQRARGAYIASICQPEASFDLSAAAQIQQPKDTEYVKLNRRLQWQSESIQRGLRYVPLDLATAKLVVFTDGSFANNQDLSSQLGYLLILANESSRQDSTFDIRGNVIHWSSTKCKRVTRSVLASETYGMVSGVDIAIAILTTLKIITGRLGLPPIPLIVCTDSYSLYECLVKLGTTAEKRLMIDIMALRQSYERREITEIRWINGEDNPADAFTKATPNRALERFIESNKLSIRVEGSVQRPTE
ncbi:hypothetical protein PtrM4_031440 [Pyrenophora tritici-repentis]|uniref:Integrase catalytic domain-containing protein n=1 Tax=Pyrenophora tritici-repentis TaxID=45151 RepID=A0A834VYH2_9PLEO|nr:hypothetical protein PtrM4_031440 [Pyrenophora tritici-repentis]